MPSDNFPITPGSGESVRVLVDAQGNGWPAGVTCYATTVSAGANVLQIVDATHGLPVNLLNASVAVTAAALPLPTGAASAANQATGNTALTAIAASVSGVLNVAPASPTAGSYLPVRLTDGSAFYVGGGGGSGAVTQSGAWNITNITGTVSLPTGAATAAAQTTGNASLASLDGKTPALGQALAAASVPVVLTTAQVTALTPPAAITGFAAETTLAAASAKLPATLGQKAMAASLAVAIASDQGAVSVSLASVPSHAVTNAGTFAVQAAQTGTWNVGTVTSVTSVSAVTAITNALPAGTNLLGKVGIDQTTPGTTNGVQVVAALPAGTNTIGVVNAQPAGDVVEIAGTTYTVKRAFVDATTSGNTTVVAAVTSKKIRVLRFRVGQVSAAVNLYFRSSTAGQVDATMCLAANGGQGGGLNHFGHFETAAGEALQINLSAAVTAGVSVNYIEV